MNTIIERITEAIKDILIGLIKSSLDNMFTSVNEQVGTIAGQVGQTPQGWNAGIFNLIQNISQTVIVPIAGLIITFVLCYELITMVTQKNNFHEFETYNIFLWIFKAYVAIYLVTNTFNITMAVFDVGQHVVNNAAGVISGNTAVDATEAISRIVDALEDMELGDLFLLSMETMLISVTMHILSIIITVILFGRMIEIYLYAACVVVPNAAGGGNGANIAKSILAKGIPTLLEHPAHEVEIVNCIRESGSAAFMLNPFYRYIKPIRDFLEAAQIISKHAHLINASLECAIHVLYDGIDILGCALGGLSTWKLGNVAESYTTSMAGGGNRVISGIIGMVPVTFIVNTNVDRNDIDHPLHLYHRIELTFSTGRLCLVNTHGPVIWLPFLHMPRDEYGTLSINVEEEVNIPSGVTIGNVMLPSVKETFEQIWPDAVKKALEILFKQNRTEKMSMAQYQIYVSKLWSEICQKVGYMNIVDYDNFGDIKSIFYDLEKRHLIKKENDGIE